MLQPFIFQIICLQLCKGLNYFLKTYNKKLNQYCLSFIVFLAKKKKKVLNMVRVTGWVKLTCKKIGQVTGQPIFASDQ